MKKVGYSPYFLFDKIFYFWYNKENKSEKDSVSMSEKQAKYKKKDFQVGQTVYIEQNAASSAYMVDTVGKIKEEVVEKVGTTYITTSS